MNKQFELKINIAAIKSAAQNCDNLDKIALELDVVNPKTLTLDDQIYGFESLPVNDKIKIPTPSTLRYIAIRKINVESLDKNITPGHITVNGTIDMPLETGKVVSINEAFIQGEEPARQIAKALTEHELQRAIDIEIDAKKAKVFLQTQVDEDRF